MAGPGTQLTVKPTHNVYTALAFVSMAMTAVAVVVLFLAAKHLQGTFMGL